MPDELVRPNRLRGSVARPNALVGGVARPVAARGRLGDLGAPAMQPPAEAELAFRPNSGAVSALLERLPRITTVEAQRLTSFWKGISKEERDRAHHEAQVAAVSSGRRHAARLAQEEALHWLDATPAAAAPLGPHAETSGRVRDWAQTRREAFPAVLDALAGLVLSDVLDAPARDALVGPWLSAIGGDKATEDRASGDPSGPGS